MKREIKFRAWDTRNERMIYNPFMFQITQEHDNETSPYTYYDEWRDWEDGIKRPCEVMQFTGLKDKNGVEIYEGDIVKLEHGHPSWIKNPFTVDFQNGAFCLKQGDLKGSCAFASYLDQCLKNNILSIEHDEQDYNFLFEVIGNIYEHKHLLQ